MIPKSLEYIDIVANAQNPCLSITAMIILGLLMLISGGLIAIAISNLAKEIKNKQFFSITITDTEKMEISKHELGKQTTSGQLDRVVHEIHRTH